MDKRIPGLDGIRGLSVLAVVATHLGAFAALEELQALPRAVTPMINGTAGVQAFFVLSGFLITWLLIAESRTTGTISLTAFFARRALRIFPLYFGFLAAAVVLRAVDPRVVSWESLAYGIAYAYNFVPQSAYAQFMGHTWSLAVEEHFYLLWPALFLLWRDMPRRLMIVIVMAIAVALVAHLVLVRTSWSATHFIARWTFVSWYAIAAGCGLAFLLDARSGQRMREWIGSRTCLLVAAALYGVPALLHGHSWTFDAIVAGYLRCAGVVLMVGWLVLHPDSAAVRRLEWRPLKYLGTISYGIYMYQGLFLATGPARVEGHAWPLPAWVGILALIVIAPASYHGFEQPLLRLKRRFSTVVDRGAPMAR